MIIAWQVGQNDSLPLETDAGDIREEKPIPICWEKDGCNDTFLYTEDIVGLSLRGCVNATVLDSFTRIKHPQINICFKHCLYMKLR